MNREIGTTVVFSITITDGENGGVTGDYPWIQLVRMSDGFLLDFDDDTFKGSGWGEEYLDMDEVDASWSPGLYSISWDSSTAILEPGEYAAMYYTNDGYQATDDEKWTHSDLADKSLVNRLVVSQAGSELILYEQDGVTVAKRWPLLDKDGIAIELTGTSPARRGVPS